MADTELEPPGGPTKDRRTPTMRVLRNDANVPTEGRTTPGFASRARHAAFAALTRGCRLRAATMASSISARTDRSYEAGAIDPSAHCPREIGPPTCTRFPTDP